MSSKKVLLLNHFPKTHPDYVKFGYRNGEAQNIITKRLTGLAQRILGTCGIEVVYPENDCNVINKEVRKSYALILGSGSPYNIDDNLPWLSAEMDALLQSYENGGGIPLVAICFTHQAIHNALEGKISPAEKYYFGDYPMKLGEKRVRLKTSHGYYVSRPGNTMEVVGWSSYKNNGERMVYATRSSQYPIVTFQQHPECPMKGDVYPSPSVPSFVRESLNV